MGGTSEGDQEKVAVVAIDEVGGLHTTRSLQRVGLLHFFQLVGQLAC